MFKHILIPTDGSDLSRKAVLYGVHLAKECRAKVTALTLAEPYRAIIDAAHAKDCDLIVMASHGRRGVSALLLGSETVKVLTHSTIPVLVYR